MLAKTYRLTATSDIELVKKEGRRFNSKNFTVLVLDRKDDAKPRFGFIISTKASPLATVRTKIKRSLHEGLRHILIYVRPGLDMVFIAKPTAARAYTGDLMNEVKQALEKAKLLK